MLLQCVSCGKSLGDQRADARYCSSACRQREYRARVREWQRWFPDPEERAEVMALGDYSEEEFDEALRLAKLDDDLSLAHVLAVLAAQRVTARRPD